MSRSSHDDLALTDARRVSISDHVLYLLLAPYVARASLPSSVAPHLGKCLGSLRNVFSCEDVRAIVRWGDPTGVYVCSPFASSSKWTFLLQMASVFLSMFAVVLLADWFRSGPAPLAVLTFLVPLVMYLLWGLTHWRNAMHQRDGAELLDAALDLLGDYFRESRVEVSKEEDTFCFSSCPPSKPRVEIRLSRQATGWRLQLDFPQMSAAQTESMVRASRAAKIWNIEQEQVATWIAPEAASRLNLSEVPDDLGFKRKFTPSQPDQARVRLVTTSPVNLELVSSSLREGLNQRSGVEGANEPPALTEDMALTTLITGSPDRELSSPKPNRSLTWEARAGATPCRRLDLWRWMKRRASEARRPQKKIALVSVLLGSVFFFISLYEIMESGLADGMAKDPIHYFSISGLVFLILSQFMFVFTFPMLWTPTWRLRAADRWLRTFPGASRQSGIRGRLRNHPWRKLNCSVGTLVFDGHRLTSAHGNRVAAIQLDEPFFMMLSRSSHKGPRGWLGIELRQKTEGGDMTRLQLQTAAAQSEAFGSLPPLAFCAPILAADALQWLWPTLAYYQEADGAPLSMDIQADK